MGSCASDAVESIERTNNRPPIVIRGPAQLMLTALTNMAPYVSAPMRVLDMICSPLRPPAGLTDPVPYQKRQARTGCKL